MGAPLAGAPLAGAPQAGQPSPASSGTSSPSPSASPGPAGTGFSGIILPDLAVIEPLGISQANLAALGRLTGVRDVLAMDGAAITVHHHTVNVLGVDVQEFRSWTQLSAASDQGLWAGLAAGGFVASPGAQQLLGLRTGARYGLRGRSRVTLTYRGAATFGVGGAELVVSNAVSAQLGLNPSVVALISAPGEAMTSLDSGVRAVLGGGGQLVSLRAPQLPVDTAPAGRPATYLQLFRASAAMYCPGMSWTVLAAIGQIESGFGTNNGPSSAGALGPMQFLPSTWRTWGITAFGETGPPNIMDPYDAVPSAARYLCAAGAGTPAGLARAIFAYNHANWYVSEVLALASEYAQQYG
ncbi:MAG TPA: lytic transglycosylase domain-containing protein [Streptosporangiaceae bacterium]